VCHPAWGPGLFTQNVKDFQVVLDESTVDIYFIDGNHEDHAQVGHRSQLSDPRRG